MSFSEDAFLDPSSEFLSTNHGRTSVEISDSAEDLRVQIAA